MRRFTRRGVLVALSLLLIVSVLGISCAGKPAAAPTPTLTPRTGATPTPLPSPTPAPVKPIKMKVSSYGGATHHGRVVIERAMKTITDKSGGRIAFEYYPGSSLLAATQTFDAVKTNVVQIAITFAIYERERMGVIYEVEVAPWSWDPAKFNANWRKPGMFYEFAEPYWNKNNMHLLALPRVPYGEILSRKPIKKMEDLKGLVIRTTTSVAPALQLLGCQPVFIGLEELYEAMQRGVVDAQTTTTSDIIAAKRYEVAKYLTICHIYSGQTDQVMNLDFYNSLPVDLRKVIDDAFIEAQDWWAPRYYDTYNEDLDALRKAGVDIYELPPDELARWKKQIQPFWDDQAKKYPAEWEKVNKIRELLS